MILGLIRGNQETGGEYDKNAAKVGKNKIGNL
jgi:hypothetical protein